MTTGNHPTRPLLIQRQPGQQALLQLGKPSGGHRQRLVSAGVEGRGFGVV
jgi:hypothetical protein